MLNRSAGNLGYQYDAREAGLAGVNQCLDHWFRLDDRAVIRRFEEMNADILITPPLPPPKSYSGFRRWLLRFKIVQESWMEARVDELEQLEGQRQSVEYGVCEFLNKNHLELEKHWSNGVSFAPQPYCITADGMSRLNSNFALKTASEDQLAVANSLMTECEFRETHGYNSQELFARKLEYLKSVAPNQLIEFDGTKLYDIGGGWNVIVSSLSGLPSLACLGIANDSIDQFGSENFANVGITKPVWDKTLLESPAG